MMEWAYPPAPPDTLRINLKGECNTIYLLLPAHFPQSGALPNPCWNITHSLYDICDFWASVPSRAILPNLEPLQILTEISHILFMTFANSGPQCLVIHFPQSGSPPKHVNIVSDWFRFLTRPISKRFGFVIICDPTDYQNVPISSCVWSNWSNKTFWVVG